MRKLTKITIFVSIALTILLIFFNCRHDIQKHNNTNILFIVLDAARADHFSCYGYERNTTPNIDAISSRGALFLNNFTQGTKTEVSLPQIFFSRYYSIPVFKEDYYRFLQKTQDCQNEDPSTIFKRYDDGQILLPEILSLNGYRTALFSEHPCLIPDISYFSRKFDEFYDCDYYSLFRSGDCEIIPKVISWLEQNKEKKFFVYCHLMSPHIPYRGKKEEAEFLRSEIPESVELVREKTQSRANNFTRKWSPEDIRILKGLYDSNLKEVDKYIGILYDKLKELGLENNTIIIITSDHGEELGDHNYRGHGYAAWDSVIHVPLIMTYPRHIPAGTKIKGMTESIDIMPTIIDICNIRIPKNKSMDGISLVEFIRRPDYGKSYIYCQNAIRSDEYKYILNKDFLYDLKNDPEEKINISNENYELKEKLRKRYKQKMHPYELRYEEAKRDDMIDYPFYYLLPSFEISPDNIIEKCHETSLRAILTSETYLNKPYVLNLYPNYSFLLFHPKKAPSLSLALSSKVPNGSYQVSILIKTLEYISYPVDQFGFRFRFDTKEPFALPCQLKYLMYYKGFNYYIELGKTEIRNERFSVEIEFIPPDKNIYIIQHIKFVPHESQKKSTTQGYDQDDMDRQLERLKTLGYAQ